MRHSEFKVEPFKGTNLLKLNLTSEEYESITNIKPEKFRRTESCDYTDDFGFCHIEYDDNGYGNSITLFNLTKVTFNGFQLLGEYIDPTEVKEYMLSIDPNCYMDEYSISSDKYCIYMYISCENYIDCVTIYRDLP